MQTQKSFSISEIDKIKLTKVESNGRPSEGYWLTGILMTPLAIGRAIKVWRMTNNGVKASGIFTSSPIQQIIYYSDHAVVYTQHSVWTVVNESTFCATPP